MIKNWPEICAVTDPLDRMELCFIRTHNEHYNYYRERFPQCFENGGAFEKPTPLSIFELALELLDGADDLITQRYERALDELAVPRFRYALVEEDWEQYPTIYDGVLPKQLQKDGSLPQWDMFWMWQRFFVVIYKNQREIVFAPLERIKYQTLLAHPG